MSTRIRPYLLAQKRWLDHVLPKVVAQRPGILQSILLLARDKSNGVDTIWPPIAVFHAYLGFSIRGKIGKQLLQPRRGQAAGKFMGEPDGQRHHGCTLVAGKAENIGLVPGRY